MSEVYIRSQNKEKLYRLGGNYASVEYGEYEDIKKNQHKAHKAYYQEVRERENHKGAVTKEYTELDGTRRTRRQL